MENYNTIIQTLPNLPNTVNLYTDGSAYWRDRSGGYAYIIEQGNKIIRSFAAGARDTTVSRMEITAALRGLESLGETRHIVQLITDSEHLGKGLAFHIEDWRNAGWKIKNPDLWASLYDVAKRHDLFITNIRGHSGNARNDEVDRLASQARKTLFTNMV